MIYVYVYVLVRSRPLFGCMLAYLYVAEFGLLTSTRYTLL